MTAHRLRGGERVAVYPVFERLDISPVIRLRPGPLRKTRFIVDVHLGKLARYLRILGFDTAYTREWKNAILIDLSLLEKRIILTRNAEVLKQNRIDPDIFRRFKEFNQCRDCGKIFWQGSHHERMLSLVDSILHEQNDPDDSQPS